MTRIAVTKVADGGPIGPRGVNFLRRVRDAGGPYRIALNADREQLDRALCGGFVVADPRNDDLVRLTEAGAAYLDRLMRVE
ncbi:hypothetical protein QN224_13105 [Sinorhizobium sp. 8-89]|nr:hypothetical protein [Sinorhizobium sp. 7-81]MDK1386347.1 hypothetical protein [Sinorhizobium sp. 7-81]